VAIVTQPLGSTEARGSVGGLTYATWRGKHTVRTRAGPSREPTAEQLYVLATAETAKNAWQAMSDDQRASWNHWAAEHREPHWTGQDKRLSGFNWWVRIFVRLTFYFGEEPSAPPTQDLERGITNIAAHQDNGAVAFTFEVTPPDPPVFDLAILNRHIPASPGRKPDIHYAQFLTSDSAAVEGIADLDPAIGPNDYWIRYINQAGLVSVWQHIRFTVAP
jgi:hypothetical protein